MAPANELRAGAGSCPDDEALAALLDGALSPDERVAIEAHAVRCDACRAALADASRALATLDADGAGVAGPSAAAVARAAEAVAAAARSAAGPHAPRILPGAAPARKPLPRWAAAAALLVVAGGVFVLLRRDRPVPDPAPAPETTEAKAQNSVPSDVLVVIAMRWVDIYWLIAPAFYEGVRIHVLDIVLFIAIGGIWLYVFRTQLMKRSLLPLRDPNFVLEKAA